jgi:hypothetical protein
MDTNLVRMYKKMNFISYSDTTVDGDLHYDTTNGLVFNNGTERNVALVSNQTVADKHVYIYNLANTAYENRVLQLTDLNDESRVQALENANTFTSDIEKNINLAQDATCVLTYDDSNKAIAYKDLTNDTFILANSLVTNGDNDPYTITNIQDNDKDTRINLGDHPGGLNRDWRVNIDCSISIGTNALKLCLYSTGGGTTFLNVNLYGSNDLSTFNETSPADTTGLNLILNNITVTRDVEEIHTYTNLGTYRYFTLIFTSDPGLSFHTCEVGTFQVRQVAGGLTPIFDTNDFLLYRDNTDGSMIYKSLVVGNTQTKINISNAIDYTVTNEILPVVHDKKRLRSRTVNMASIKWVRVAQGTPLNIGKDAEGYINDAYNLIPSDLAVYTVSLPDSPQNAERIVIYDYGNNAVVNNITINPSGLDTIDGNASLVINVNDTSIELIYDLPNGNWVSNNLASLILLHEDDQNVMLQSTSFTSAVTLHLPTNANIRQGSVYFIKDNGNAGNQNININPNGELLDLFPIQQTIGINFDTMRIIWDGTQYWLM